LSSWKAFISLGNYDSTHDVGQFAGEFAHGIETSAPKSTQRVIEGSFFF